MSEIRVNYSGLVSFATGIVGIFTGLIFTLVVTRSLTSLEFGTWNIINNFFAYVVILEPIVSIWVTREISRRTPSGFTALITSGLLSSLGILIYLLVVYLIGSNTDADVDILTWGVLLIPLNFIMRTLSAINLSYKPQFVSYGLLVHGIVQIPAIIYFMFYLDMGVIGIILSTLVAYISNIFVQTYLGRSQLKNHFSLTYVKKWFKLSWIAAFPAIHSFLSLLDITIFTILTESVIGLAFWGASFAVATIIAQAGNISKAVYPKLLNNDNTEYLKDNFTLLLYFAIPLTLLSICFSKPLLFALNPEYMIAYPVLIFTSIFVLFNTLNTTFYSILLGTEKVDLDKHIIFSSYVKSKLFSLPLILIVQNAIYILVFTVILFYLISLDYSQIDLVMYWSIIALVTLFPFTIYFIIRLRKTVSFKIDSFRIIKFLLIGLFSFGSISLLSEYYLQYDEILFNFMPELIKFVSLSIVIYYILTLITDKQTRSLTKNILNEFKH